MRIFAPLRHRSLARLWAGQVLSALGDEVNRVATVWLAATLWGTSAGRLMALQAGCAFVVCLGGGLLVDRTSFARVLVMSDLIRALAVLAVPVGAALGAPLAPVLLVSVAICASVSAVFDPALRALTLQLVPSPEVRGPANALMESTVRFARVLGPACVALASAALSTMHFFVLDAATFGLSALSIVWIGAAALGARREPGAVGASATDGRATLGALRADPVLFYAISSGAVTTAAWWLMLPLGMTLLLRAIAPGDVSALASVLLAYGAGNLASNLIVGNFTDRPPVLLLSVGRVIAGLGFLLYVAAPTRGAMMAAAALAAAGGPLTDVGFLAMVQERFDGVALARVYRLNLAVGYAAMFVLFFASPVLFASFGVGPVAAGAAACIAATGLYGLWRFRGTAPASARVLRS